MIRIIRIIIKPDNNNFASLLYNTILKGMQTDTVLLAHELIASSHDFTVCIVLDIKMSQIVTAYVSFTSYNYTCCCC